MLLFFFTKNNNLWEQLSKLIPSTGATQYGATSLSADGRFCLISNNNFGGAVGNLYVFS